MLQPNEEQPITEVEKPTLTQKTNEFFNKHKNVIMLSTPALPLSFPYLGEEPIIGIMLAGAVISAAIYVGSGNKLSKHE